MTQWGVGHGGFHTVEIRQNLVDARSYRYIYDCGSKALVKSLNPRIESYVQSLKDAGAYQVDTLYLSHFDFDHVNGLKKLSSELNSNIQIVKIVVPFLTIEQQFAILASQDSRYSALYVNLVLNPEGTLTRLFPGAEVEFLFPSEEVGFPDEGHLSPNTPGSEGVPTGPYPSGIVEPLWEVIAYAQPGVPATAREFWRQVQSELEKQMTLNVDTVKELIENHRKKLREIAVRVLGADGSNASSIVLYSAPSRGRNVSCFIKFRHRRIGWEELPLNAAEWWGRNSKKFGGWLSTGDARLKGSGNVRALERGLGKQRCKRVTVIAAPHHGSENNSDSYLWKSFANATVVTVHAADNTSHHPHKKVLDELKLQDRKPFVLNDKYRDIVMCCRVYS